MTHDRPAQVTPDRHIGRPGAQAKEWMMVWTGRAGRVLGAVALAGFALVATTQAAGASLQQPAVVSEDPADFTPNLLEDAVVTHPTVYGLAKNAAGTTIYAGGEFHSVQNSTRTTTYIRNNLMAFNTTTGAVSATFKPVIDGPVWAMKLSPDGKSLYAGGEFRTVGGLARRGLVKLNATTGAIDPAFDAHFTVGEVSDIKVVNGRLIVGGTFPQSLAAFDLRSGADTGYLNLNIAGTVASNAGRTGAYRITPSPDGTKLMAIGNWTSVSGQPRSRAFMVNLGATSGTLATWHYTELATQCKGPKTPAQLRDVDFSPDGKYFVIVATGSGPAPGHLGRALCDAAARFETATTAPTQPTWINYTGGDTLHSVAVTGAAVYVQGHNRWLDNPQGSNSCGPGCAPREGIGAINSTTGKALPWNPGKTRAVGGKDMLATTTGLWVASDGKQFNGEYRYGIAFLPLP